MTEKRFTIKKSGKGLFYSDGDYSIDNTIQFVIETVESKLNQLNDENNELKSRVCDCHIFLSSKTMVENCNEELRKENEQLKQDNQRLIKMLDNVANYMQKEHREIPLDDFVEWWNKMATEGLNDSKTIYDCR